MPELHLLDRVYWGASVTQWLLAVVTFGAVYVVLALARRVVARRLGALAARTETKFDDYLMEMVRRTRTFFLVVIALQAAMRVVTPDGRAATVLGAISVVAVLVQIGLWGGGLIAFAAEQYAQQRGDADIGARATIRAVGYAARFVLWTLLIVTGLDNFGVEITGLITGLGIGGIAIALAVQNILGDLFAALAIVVDKPFVVGETIHVDTIIGTVEHVGLKTTRLRSITGEQVIISNADLLKSRIRNYKRMTERRATFTVDIRYGTPPDKVDQAPKIIRAIIEAQQLTRFDRSHFMTWMESGLRIETVYYILSPEYGVYADLQHAINVEILRQFDAAGILFGVPSRIQVPDAPADDAVATSTPTARSPRGRNP